MLFMVLLCGLIGLALGGFEGLVVGSLVGYAISAWLPRLVLKRLAVVQSQLLDSTFAAMGAICKADSRVTREEIQAAEALFDRMRLSPAEREAAKSAFNRGKSPEFDLDSEMARLAQICRGRRVLLGMFLQVQLLAVAADGQVHPAEHDMLVRMARRLGLAADEVARLEALLRAATAGTPASPSKLQDAYQALGVRASASDTEIKRAYRKLMSENHPDKLAGRGLPESMREIAEERTREITAAYRVVIEARGAAP